MPISAANMANNLLALVIVVGFFLILYVKMTNKSFSEVFKQIKEAFGGE